MTELLVKLGAPVVLVLLSQILDLFFLPAPGSWLPGVGAGLRYLTAFAGAALAHRLAPSRAAAVIVSILLVLICGFGYQYLIQNPPTVNELVWWSVLMPVTFVLTYFSTGFLVASVIGILWPKP